jgi:uncharacterized delta-60 repeat protein
MKPSLRLRAFAEGLRLKTTRSSVRPSRRNAVRPRIEALEGRLLLTANALDPSFGSNGMVTTHIGPAGATSDDARGLALQPDGKVVAVGRASTGYFSSTGYVYDFGVVRYNANGTLDNTFGSGGITTTAVVSDHAAQPSGVGLQTDGKIVVSGFADGYFAVLRYLPNGSLDTTFGGNARGKVLTHIAQNSADTAFGMKIQGDGKIVLMGTTQPSDFSTRDLALVRYKADGSLDTSFGGGGKVTTHFNSPLSPWRTSMHMALYPSTSPQAGKIIVVMELQTSFSSSNIVVVRYNPNGSLDPTFGGGAGYVTLATGDLHGQTSTFPSCAIQADDRIVLTYEGPGSGSGQGTLDVKLARFQPDGALDATFGTAGLMTTPLPGDQIPGSITIQADGKIVVAGWQTGNNFFATRYRPSNGSLDTTFGGNGITASTGVSIVGVGTATSVDAAIQPDGKIVMAAKKKGGDFALARFLGDSASSPVTVATTRETVRNLTPLTTVTPAPGPDSYVVAPVVDLALNEVDLFHPTRRRRGLTSR